MIAYAYKIWHSDKSREDLTVIDGIIDGSIFSILAITAMKNIDWIPAIIAMFSFT